MLFGTDSHTCNAGAFGQFATGVGNTDAGFILGTGKLLIKVCICAMRAPMRSDMVLPLVTGTGIMLAVLEYGEAAHQGACEDILWDRQSSQSILQFVSFFIQIGS